VAFESKRSNRLAMTPSETWEAVRPAPRIRYPALFNFSWASTHGYDRQLAPPQPPSRISAWWPHRRLACRDSDRKVIGPRRSGSASRGQRRKWATEGNSSTRRS